MTADFLIAGGGAAGCVLAARLSSAGARVLLLEAGPPYPGLPLDVPLPSLRRILAHSWRFLTIQQPGLAWRRLSLPLGKVVGGSSSINAMMYCRGTRADYDAWAAAGNPGWDFASLLPSFLRAEDWRAAPAPLHGSGGPLTVSAPRHQAPFSRAFLAACAECGVPPALDLDASAPASGCFPVTQRRGARVSTARAYLARLGGRARVLTGALVSRVYFEGRRAAGVEFFASGRLQRAFAGEVILSAGAVNSPKLLMLSGIGPAAHLDSLGIPVLQDLPGVGRHLQDHPRVPVLYLTPQPSPGRMARWVPAAVEYALARRGVLTSNCCEAGAFVRSSDLVSQADLQFVTHFQSHLDPGAVDLQLCLLDTRSRGSVQLLSADPASPPRVDLGLLAHPEDVRRMIAGVRFARRLAASSALRDFPLTGELLPGPGVDSDQDIEHHLRATADTCFHPAGSCRMGPDPLSVVDPSLRVHGLQNLRIVDASIMPSVIHGNTLAPVVAIAERAADLLR